MITATRPIIAVVDDDPGVLESLENLLRSFKYEVRPYGSAAALLADAAFADIDCLISDIGMPLMDGLELQALVAGRRPRLPVILITGRDDGIEERAAAANNRGVFHKPLDASALLDALAVALQGVV